MTCCLDLFYVRNHLPVPDVDVKNYELEVSGLGVKVIFILVCSRYYIMIQITSAKSI